MEVKKKSTSKKTWGDSGFAAKIQFGCYEYTIKFLPEKDVIKYID